MTASEPLDLAAIRARCDAATEGPWVAAYDRYDENDVPFPTSVGPFVYVEHGGPREIADAEFVVHARTDLPALLAALAERDATIARYDTALIEAARTDDEDDGGEPTREALIETIAATDEERDRLEAEVEQLRAQATERAAVVERWIADANNGLGSDPNDLAWALEQLDASRAPESPADPAAHRATPDAR